MDNALRNFRERLMTDDSGALHDIPRFLQFTPDGLHWTLDQVIEIARAFESWSDEKKLMMLPIICPKFKSGMTPQIVRHWVDMETEKAARVIRTAKALGLSVPPLD